MRLILIYSPYNRYSLDVLSSLMRSAINYEAQAMGYGDINISRYPTMILLDENEQEIARMENGDQMTPDGITAWMEAAE